MRFPSFFKAEPKSNLPEVDLHELKQCREEYNKSIKRFNEELQGKPRKAQECTG